MKHLFFTTTRSAWRGITRIVESAHHSIYIEMYIFVDDSQMQKDFIQLLIQKVQSGVRVKIILDWFGSAGLSRESITAMQNAGIELLFFKKFFRRLHRKMVIVDERIGFIGGVNMHKSAVRWHDLFIRVQGEIVHSMIRSFRHVYKACGGTDPEIIEYKKKAFLGGTRMMLLEHLPSIQKASLKARYIEYLESAQKHVFIATPYFLPHRWLKQLLLETAQRGVHIDILVPANTDIGFITRANKRYMSMLAQRKIQFWMQNEMNHGKLLVIDRTIAVIGSQNIDALSFDFNVEGAIVSDDPDVLHDLERIIDDWMRNSRQFDPSRHVTFFDRIISPLVRLLQPWL